MPVGTGGGGGGYRGVKLAVPTDVPAGTTYRVPVGTQSLLYHVGIDVEGTLQVDGFLVAV